MLPICWLNHTLSVFWRINMSNENEMREKFGVSFICCSKALVKQFDLTTSCLYGLIWSYSQLSKGYCCASETNLGDILGCSRQTISKKIGLLKSEGLINIRSPQSYKGGGKVLRITCNPDRLFQLECQYKDELDKAKIDTIEVDQSEELEVISTIY